MGSALRWLRAEYRTKTEARQDLEVRSTIDDAQFYDYLKLFAAFVRLAGFAGLLVNIDEMGVFSHRLNSSQARKANYEVLLRILNDCLQGNVAGIGFLFGGTNTFLEDRRRGVFSYEALATRLADNAFAANGPQGFLRASDPAPKPLARRPFRPVYTMSATCLLSATRRSTWSTTKGSSNSWPLRLDAGGRLLPDSPRCREGFRGLVFGDRTKPRNGLEGAS